MEKIEVNPENVPPDLKPDENITLWRYMSFASICDILMNDHIPLISVGKFNDETEGRVLEKSLEKMSNTHGIDVYRTFQMSLQLTQVSSWQKAKFENKDMWEQYTGKKEGVAIKTNAKLLLDSMPKDVTEVPPFI